MNELNFQIAKPEQLDDIFDMYTKAIARMNSNHIYQWDELYPDREILAEDIEKGQMTVVTCDGRIAAAYVLNQECDEEYKDGRWNFPDASYCVIHRLCVNPDFQHQGIAKRAALHIEEELRAQRIESIRLDAFTQNPYALRLYKSLGYQITGYVNWRKGKFYLLEKYI